MKILIFLLAVSFFKTGYAQIETYTVSGILNFNDTKGTVYIYLVDEEHFPVPFTGVKEQKINVTKSEIQYKFENVKHGEYAIRCFQDLNGNRKLDKGMFGPKEPYGLSWKNEKCFPFDFEDVSFPVNKNLIINLNVE